MRMDDTNEENWTKYENTKKCRPKRFCEIFLKSLSSLFLWHFSVVFRVSTLSMHLMIFRFFCFAEYKTASYICGGPIVTSTSVHCQVHQCTIFCMAMETVLFVVCNLVSLHAFSIFFYFFRFRCYFFRCVPAIVCFPGFFYEKKQPHSSTRETRTREYENPFLISFIFIFDVKHDEGEKQDKSKKKLKKNSNGTTSELNELGNYNDGKCVVYFRKDLFPSWEKILEMKRTLEFQAQGTSCKYSSQIHTHTQTNRKFPILLDAACNMYS